MEKHEANESRARLIFRLLEGGTKIECVRSQLEIDQRVLDEWLGQISVENRLQAGDVMIAVHPHDTFDFVSLDDRALVGDRYTSAWRVACDLELRLRYYEAARERMAI